MLTYTKYLAWLLIPLLAILIAEYPTMALAQGSKSANSVAKAQSAPSVTEVRELLQQLDSMSDPSRQLSAEQLGSRLLAELDYRPEIERLRGQRAALLQIQTSLTDTLNNTTKQLETQRSRLMTQLRDIESQSKSDAATIERRKSAALQSSAPGIRRLIANQSEYSKQLKDLAQRMDRCEATELSLIDQLSICLESGYVPIAPSSLPRESNRPQLRIPTEIVSASDKPNPESTKKLMHELGLDPK